MTPLSGSVTDAKNIQRLVQELSIYRPNQIRLLTDSQATRQGILDGLEWLISGSQPGDSVLFHYSGHGAQVVDTNSDEEDGLDETLCPVETTLTRTGMITDDEINERLKRLKGRKVLVVIDACHSGTIAKGNIPKGVQLKTPTFTKSLPETKAITNESLVSSAVRDEEMVVYSAVAANQVAIDTTDGGIFTSAFIKAITEKKGKISHKEILEITRQASAKGCQEYLSVCRLGLTPQLEVSENSLEGKAIFSVNRSSGPNIPLRDMLSIEILPSTTLRIGDEIRFNITNNSQQTGYIVIWDIDSKGQVNRLFPDKDDCQESTGYLQVDQTLMIPDPNDCEFKMGEPGKGATVIAFADSESVAKQISALSMDYSASKKIERVSKNKAQEVATQVKKKLVEILQQDNVVFSQDYEVIR